LLITIFGVSYALAALDPARNRPLIVIGALGKASFVLFTSLHALANHIPQIVYQLSMSDLTFALIFVFFLYQTRKPASAPSPQTGSA